MADDEKFDIKEFEKEIETWARGVSPEVRSAFASICAARALPNIIETMRPKERMGFSLDLNLLRTTITSKVAGINLTAHVENAGRFAASSLRATRSAHSSPSARSALSAVSSSFSSSSTASAAASSAFSATPAFMASYPLPSTAYAAHATHAATKLLNQSAPKALFERPLWLDVPWPDKIAENWATLRGEWSTDPAMAFWIDWYEGLLEGRSPDWDLWHDIVLIDDEHWNAGPEAVAREIGIIQAAHDLDAAIARLEDDILLLSFEDQHQGNRPDENPEVRAQFLIYKRELLEALRDIKEEREKLRLDPLSQPDPVKLKGLAQKILDLGRKFLQGCALAAGIATSTVVGDIAAGVAQNYDIQDKAVAAITRGIDDVVSSINRFADKLATRPKPNSKPVQTMDSPVIEL
ncbi:MULTISPECIES: hypothetical protein [Pacificibacter]|uniref:hypothetical protein n=1 Tax=Pacificibacter TaxID=1042323 RepID=UPI001C09827B|nr:MULTISPECIES: hypothetical protein [Pacificibacter]MBU2935930.1 hypothetical protein [Pacificibacter marinus]MDO6614425.1 hypothetical protein [Pacificibacter sp. 1_MG-2023]